MLSAFAVNFSEPVGGENLDSQKLLPNWKQQTGGALPLIDYIYEQVRGFFSHGYSFFASIVVGSGFWQGLQQQFGGMIITDAFFWLPTFWLVSWIAGSLWAFRDNRWSRKKALHSVWKLVGYMLILAVAHGLRHFSYIGGYPASLMEVACIFVEGYNAMENAAGLTDNAWLKRMIRTSKCQIEDKLSRLIGAFEQQKEVLAEVKNELAEAKAVVVELKSTVQPVAAAVAEAVVTTLVANSNQQIKSNTDEIKANKDAIAVINESKEN